VTSVVRTAWELPRAPGAPARVWRDWVLVGVLVALAVVEASARPELPWLWPSVLIEIGLIATLLWRRTHPGLMSLIAFGVVLVTDTVRWAAGVAPTDLYTMAFLLILPYALVRWGSGREIMLVGALILLSMARTLVWDAPPLTDVVGAIAVVTAAVSLGAAFRYHAASREQRVAQVRAEERARIARDLHDTVAHHISAIAIRAQAGSATVRGGTDAAADALRVIEAEARTALREMRSMVGVLRGDETAGERAPVPGIAALRALTATGNGPAVSLRIDGDPDALPAPIATAVYRTVQEAITNARTHAAGATRIDVDLAVSERSVRVRVRDDGRGAAGEAPPGFGIVGMVERAELLGGTCRAGPDAAGGWAVTAELPLTGGSP